MTETYAIDAYGNPFIIPADELKRQQDALDHLRQVQANARRDDADLDNFMAAIGDHFGLTRQQVEASGPVVRECWEALRYEAERRKSEAARGAA